MPQVVAEALSTGLPVMTTPVGDIPDLVRHRENGWLMPEHAAAEEWAVAIQTLLDNPDKLAMLRKNAREFAERTLTLERFQQGFRSGIETLLADTSRH